ncbi:hypothetical protein GQ44DRAFT_621333 [Phaeosphaeriaceae sp. PMI808]|nr:hypothetical protein GQ44DRAFT_621333 [Phaeosphaeriaceae sp. PMI808]
MQGTLYAQWHNPGDILSVLLILGPDIVKTAVGQLTGRAIVPVAFSFGWVAYALSALLSTVGDGRLMPDTDMANILVIGAISGHVRTTKSWVLGRLLRDLDNIVDKEMACEAPHHQPDKEHNEHEAIPFPTEGTNTKTKAWEALRVSVYEVNETPPCGHGVPILDWAWFSGFVIIIIQFGISAIPWALHNDWSAFLLTACGNSLALVEGSLPQWREEKWACTKKGGATVTITQGNGTRHAVVIKGKRGVGLDFEILAQGTRVTKASPFTRFAIGGLAILWILFLITTSGIKEHTWYILAIGLLGSMQNVLVAGVPRSPSALGVHLNFIETIRGKRVAHVLKELEEKHPFVGTSLLSVFFPGGLRVKGDDLTFWHKAMSERLNPNKFGTRIDLLPPAPAHSPTDMRSV